MKSKSLFVMALVAGCGQPALTTYPTENPSIPYEVLFTRHGCEVGRFYDFGRPVYVTVCPGSGVSASQSSYVESCGKNCQQVIDRHHRQIRAPMADGTTPAEPLADGAPPDVPAR